MSTTFVDEVRRALKTGGYAKVTDTYNEEGGTFIIGYNRNLYVMEADYQIGMYHDGYAAVGSGGMVARGCLFGTQAMKDPKRRVELALKAAEHCVTTVRGPFVIMEQK